MDNILPPIRLSNRVFRYLVRHLELETLIKLSLWSIPWRNKLRLLRDPSILYGIDVIHNTDAFHVKVTSSNYYVFEFHVFNGGLTSARTLADTERLTNVTMSSDSFGSFWQDYFHGMREIVEYCVDFFGYQVYKHDLLNCQVHDLARILRDLQSPTNELRISYDRHYKSDETARITLEQLCNFRTPIIYLARSGITFDEVNTFLRHWQQGGSPGTRYVHITMGGGDFGQIFDGIEVTERGRDVIRVYRDDEDERFNITFRGGYDIRRHGDQRIATCPRLVGATNSFRMFVWTDEELGL